MKKETKQAIIVALTATAVGITAGTILDRTGVSTKADKAVVKGVKFVGGKVKGLCKKKGKKTEADEVVELD